MTARPPGIIAHPGWATDSPGPVLGPDGTALNEEGYSTRFPTDGGMNHHRIRTGLESHGHPEIK